jgi:hypothetical protein
LQQGWGVKRRRGQKASISMVERGLVKKVSFSSLEMSVVKKSISAWLGISKKNK